MAFISHLSPLDGLPPTLVGDPLPWNKLAMTNTSSYMTSAKLENITRSRGRGLQNRCAGHAAVGSRWGNRPLEENSRHGFSSNGNSSQGFRIGPDLNSRRTEPVPGSRLGCLGDSTDYVFKSQLIILVQTLQQQVGAARGWSSSSEAAAAVGERAAAGGDRRHWQQDLGVSRHVGFPGLSWHCQLVVASWMRCARMGNLPTDHLLRLTSRRPRVSLITEDGLDGCNTSGKTELHQMAPNMILISLSVHDNQCWILTPGKAEKCKYFNWSHLRNVEQNPFPIGVKKKKERASHYQKHSTPSWLLKSVTTKGLFQEV